MKHPFHSWASAGRMLLALFLLLGNTRALFAEGSADFINRPGHRLHLVGNPLQQFKVFAKDGEFINVGSSNLFQGGSIRVYKPDGSLAKTFDENLYNTDGTAGIDSLEEEIAGPVGKATGGFKPGVVEVKVGEAGVWTIVFVSPHTSTDFQNLLNNEKWTVLDQTFSMTIIAWDVTVSQNRAADQGGTRLKGRLYSQELSTFIHEIDHPTSPRYFVLTADGYLYKVELDNLDPIRFWFSSNNVGIVSGDTKQPYYKSVLEANYEISSNVASWQPNKRYYYDPQEPDNGLFVNNKVFINPPSADLPLQAPVTNVFNNNSYSTWLNRPPASLSVVLGGFTIGGSNGVDTCFSGTIQQGNGGTFHFSSNQLGLAEICLDINNNGSFADGVDRKLYGNAIVGNNSVYWDGKDGLGNDLPAADMDIPYKLSIRAGGMHILYRDVENSGGFTLELQNTNLGTSDLNSYYYDHSEVGGTVSGGGTPGNPLATTMAAPYSNIFGDMKLMNYWKYYTLSGSLESVINIIIKDDCNDNPPPPSGPDHDGDGIVDNVDLDDDNDGVPDAWEYCNPNGSFACVPNGIDPSLDADADGVLNFQDANDPAYPNTCQDLNADGTCDNLPAGLDTDGDGVADHWDLDSDNDGITDLTEAGHNQADANGNGVIDGANSDFGPNGLFDLIDADPTSLSSTATYVRWDFDTDGVPDHDDLDSDNDGINDVIENAHFEDTNGDGRFDGTSNANGLPSAIDPANTSTPIANPIDTDNDGIPDWHDLDTDGDGIWDVMEGGVPDPDFDGIVGTGTPTVNANGQGTGTTSNPTNTDGDDSPDFRELDSDNDFIPDGDECPSGTPCIDGDGDGAPDFQDKDRDDDGIDDDWECETSTPCVDTDDDGVSDVDDLDSDNDGLTDETECPNNGPCPDGDMDGIPDFREFDCTVIAPGGIPTLENTSGGGTYCAGEDVVLTGQNTLDTIGGPIFYVVQTGVSTIVAAGFLTNVTDFASYTINNITAADAGTYTLILAGKNGCASPPVNFDIIVQDDLAAPNLTVSDANPCGSGDVTLSIAPISGAGVTYEWFFNGTSLTTTNDASLVLTNATSSNSGDYNVIVHTTGCDSPNSNSVSLNVTDAPGNLTASNSLGGPTCEGGDATLSLTNVPAGATVVWSGPNGFNSTDQSPTISGLTTVNAGDYSAVVTVNGCDFPSTTTSLFINATPGTPVLASASNSPCAGSDAVLTTANAGGSITYDWYFNGNLLLTTATPSLTLPNFSAVNAGDYSVILNGGTCSSGNSNLLSLGVVDPGVALTATNSLTGPVCEGGSATLTLPNVPGATYAWTGPNGFTSSQNPATISPLTASNSGSYSAIVTLNGCDFPSTPTALTINALPGTPTLSTVANAPCKGGTATLTSTAAAPGVSYEWYLNGVLVTTTSTPTLSIPNFAQANTGNYTVVINGGTCSSPASNAVNLGITDPGTLTATNSLSGPVCTGGSATLSLANVPGATCVWSGPNGYSANGFSVTISPLTVSNSGSYVATVSLNGCTFPSTPTSIAVNALPGTPTLQTANNVPCIGGTATLTCTAAAGTVTYEWYLNGVLVATTTVPTLSIPNFSAANTGNYTVVVNGGSCSSPASTSANLGITDPGSPTASNDAPALLCDGLSNVTLSLTGVPSGATVSWTGPNGFASNQASPVILAASLSNSGTYVATVSLNGCTSPSASTNFQVAPVPAIAQVSNNGPLCSNGTAVLTVANPSPGANYKWFDGAGNLIGTTTDPTFTLPSPVAGNYTVQTSLNGCIAALSAATNLQVDQLPNIAATVDNAVIYNCGGTSVTVSANNPSVGTGVWSTQNAGVSFGNANANLTSVNGISQSPTTATWTLSNGTCVNYSSASAQIISETFVDIVDDAYTIAAGATLSNADITLNDPLTGISDWKIEISKQPLHGTATLSGDKLNYVPNANYQGPDELEYTICSEHCPNLCSTAKVKIQVGDDFFIPNVITPDDDGKNDGLVIPGLENFGNNRLCVFNRYGHLILDDAPYNNDWKGTWNDENLPAGTYFIMLFPDKADKDRVYSQYMTIVR